MLREKTQNGYRGGDEDGNREMEVIKGDLHSSMDTRGLEKNLESSGMRALKNGSIPRSSVGL